MTTHCICIGGASDSSSSAGKLAGIVDDIADSENLDVSVHDIEEKSTRGIRRRAMVAQEWAGPDERVLYVGKSLGAIRMFRALKRGGLRCDGIVSIDPLNAPRLLVCYDVRVPAWIQKMTVNVYQDMRPRGVMVKGAQNIRAIGCDHLSIISSDEVRVAIIGTILLLPFSDR